MQKKYKTVAMNRDQETRCFKMDGQSMDDNSRNALCDQDILLGMKVTRNRTGNNFVLILKGRKIICNISKTNPESHLIICQFNNHLFSEFLVEKCDILEVFKLTSIVDRDFSLPTNKPILPDAGTN